MQNGRRGFLKFLAGFGLGATGAELYERLYNIPALERRFRSEVTHWMNEYNSAREMMEKLSEQVKSEISRLNEEVKNWKNQYNSAIGEVNRLGSTIREMDALEKESTAAISLYRERMEEAKRRLESTIQKYRAILGDERVSFESSSLKVLEDFHITKENLDKIIKYFPLIKTLSYSPTKIVNDKIYDLKVSLEVISPINTLEEVEVKLIPVEYEYFITTYGMRREDYNSVFPPEETRVVKLNPKGLEQEMFSVNFTNLKGGREYIIKAKAKDLAGNANSEEIKTSYIREFENLGRVLYERGIIIGASYMSGYYPWHTGKIPDDYPLLGRYDATNPILQWKHVDWAGHGGINVFFIDGGAWEDWKISGVEGSIMRSLMDRGMKCAFMWGAWGDYFKRGTNHNAPEWSIDLTYPQNKDNFVNQLSTILNTHLINHPNYFKVNEKPVIFIHDATAFIKETNAFTKLRSEANKSVFFLGDTLLKIPALPENSEWFFQLKDFSNYDGISTWVGFIDANVAKRYNKNYDELYFLASEKWQKWVVEQGKSYVSSVIPGFKYIWESEGIKRSLGRFEKQLFFSLHLVNFIRIDTWNDFGENTFIEPSRLDGFTYLSMLREILLEFLRDKKSN